MTTVSEEIQNYSKQFNSIISKAIKNLIEEKHHYQSFSIDFEPVLSSMPKERANSYPSTNFFAAAECGRIPILSWYPQKGKYLDEFGLIKFQNEPSIFVFQIPTVKVFCTKCDRLEPFNPYQFEDDRQFAFRNFYKQLYFFQFQCQSCKGNIISYLISRDKNKLMIVGRDPIELPVINRDFPKNEKKWISDALVARNCGQILPAIFLVRTFIEQYLRRLFPGIPMDKNSTELLFENYNKTLPDDFKCRFPSFAKIYSDLSALIHEAREDIEILNNSIISLKEHFEAKRVFKIENN